MSDLYGEFTTVAYMASGRFDAAAANAIVRGLEGKCAAFVTQNGQGSLRASVEVVVEARYPKQVWEIEIPVPNRDFDDPAALPALVQAFHAEHRTLFQISDDASGIEVIAWRAFVRCVLKDDGSRAAEQAGAGRGAPSRPIYLGGKGWTHVPVRRAGDMAADERLSGPAIVESPFTTVVVDEGSTAVRTSAGGLVIHLRTLEPEHA